MPLSPKNTSHSKDPTDAQDSQTSIALTFPFTLAYAKDELKG